MYVAETELEALVAHTHANQARSRPFVTDPPELHPPAYLNASISPGLQEPWVSFPETINVVMLNKHKGH